MPVREVLNPAAGIVPGLVLGLFDGRPGPAPAQFRSGFSVWTADHARRGVSIDYDALIADTSLARLLAEAEAQTALAAWLCR